MSSAKQATKTEINKLRNIFHAEISSLKENNRELARSLAEKCKENINLKEIEYKYRILESKLKINQEQHLSSISNLEEYVTKTCSLLLSVVKTLSIIRDSLLEEKRLQSSFSEAETEKSVALGDEGTLLLNKTPPLRQADRLLRRIFTTYSPVLMGIVSPVCHENINLSDEEKANIREGCETVNQSKLPFLQEASTETMYVDNGDHSVEEHTLMNSNSVSTSNSKNVFQNILANKESTMRQSFNHIEKNEWFFETKASASDQSDTTEDFDMLLNEDIQRIEELHLMNTTANDTFHFSQDESFQEIFADEETIVRKGTDVYLVLQRDSSLTSCKSSTGKMESSSNQKEDNIYENIPFVGMQERTKCENNRIAASSSNQSFTRLNCVENINSNELRVDRKPYLISDNCDITQQHKLFLDPTKNLESVTRAFVDFGEGQFKSKSNELPFRETERLKNSHSLTKNKFNETLKSQQNIYNETKSKSENSNLSYFSSDIKSSINCSEQCPNLYKCMLTLKLGTNSVKIVNDKVNTEKENLYCNNPRCRELRQCERDKFIKSIQSTEKEMPSIENSGIKFFRNGNVSNEIKKQISEKDLSQLKKSFTFQEGRNSKKAWSSKKKSQRKSKKT